MLISFKSFFKLIIFIILIKIILHLNGNWSFQLILLNFIMMIIIRRLKMLQFIKNFTNSFLDCFSFRWLLLIILITVIIMLMFLFLWWCCYHGEDGELSILLVSSFSFIVIERKGYHAAGIIFVLFCILRFLNCC